MDNALDDTIRALRCPSCKTRFVAGQGHPQMACPYCGHDLVDGGAADAGLLPEATLPFRVTREQALESLRAHCARRRYAKRDFEPTVVRASAAYVPFLLCDVEVEGEAETIVTCKYVHRIFGMRDHPRHITRCFRAHANGRGTIEGMPVCLSRHASDSHMRNVAPFDASALERGCACVTSGVPVEVGERDTLHAQDRELELAHTFLLLEEERSLHDSVPRDRVLQQWEGPWGNQFCEREWIVGEHNVMLGTVHDQGSRVRVVRSRTVAAPVWLLCCSWRGDDYQYVVNGQSGACAGDLPTSEVAVRWGKAASHPIPVALRRFAILWACVIGIEVVGILGGGGPSFVAMSAILVLVFGPFGDVISRDKFTTYMRDAVARAEDAHARHLREVRGTYGDPDVREMTGADVSQLVDVEATATELDGARGETVEEARKRRVRAARALVSYAGPWWQLPAHVTQMEKSARGDGVPPVENMHVEARRCDGMPERAYRASTQWDLGEAADRDSRVSLGKAYGEVGVHSHPVSETFVTVRGDVADEDRPGELFLTSRGVMQVRGGDVADVDRPVSWEELAWSKALHVVGPPSFVGLLGDVARSLCPWESVVSSQPMLAAEIVMADHAREACSSHPLRATREVAARVCENLVFDERACGRVLLAYESGEGDTWRGFALTETGFVCSDAKRPNRRVAVEWSELPILGEPLRLGSQIRAGGVSLAVCEADGAIVHALVATCRALYDRACEVYGDDALEVLLAYHPATGKGRDTRPARTAS